MSAVTGERMTVRLTGGGPWGFRLQGGAGTGQPLTVAKIRRKSRSHKNLLENDVIISITDQSCAGLSYDEAMNIVDGAGSTLILKIIRPAKGKENIAPQTTESGSSSPIIFHNETIEQTKNLNDARSSETVIRRSENISYQSHQLRQSETSPQPSKPFPDPDESLLHHQPQPIELKTNQSPPPRKSNQDSSPQISPPLPRQPDPSLHKPLLSYGFAPSTEHIVNSIEPSRSVSKSVTSQTYSQSHQQKQHQFETVQHVSSSHQNELNSECPYAQFQKQYESMQKREPIQQEYSTIETTEPHSQTTRQYTSMIEPRKSHVHLEERSIQTSPQSYSQTLRQYDTVHKIETSSDHQSTAHRQQQYVASEPRSFVKPEAQFEISQQKSYTEETLPTHSTPPSIFVGTTNPSLEPLTVSTQSSHFESHSDLFHTPTIASPAIAGHTWRPSQSSFTSSVVQETIRTERQELQETPLAGMDAKPTDVMKVKGFPAHIFYPPEEEEEMDTSLFTRRRKMYSSSSFYEEPGSIYPTVEEQVELCRKIADSLSADTNKKSRGANMFFKRVKRSHKWIHEGPDRSGSDGGFTSDSDYDSSTPDPSKMKYIKVSKGPPKLKLIMAPKPVQDVIKLRTLGQSINEHNVVSPDICKDLVRDLNSPCGKGAAMFAKRKQKAEDWVVDEEKVKAHVAQLASELPKPPKTPDFPWSARLRLIKSPWEAALESPIGSCDAAFSEVSYRGLKDAFTNSLITAAENKVRNNPNGPPPPLLATLTNDLRMPKAPKGWTGTTTTESFPSLETSSTVSDSYDAIAARLMYEPTVTPRNMVYHDFNTRPRSWAPGCFSSRGFRSVRPPTH